MADSSAWSRFSEIDPVQAESVLDGMKDFRGRAAGRIPKLNLVDPQYPVPGQHLDPAVRLRDANHSTGYPSVVSGRVGHRFRSPDLQWDRLDST